MECAHSGDAFFYGPEWDLMRKLLAAFLVAALSLVSFAIPARADSDYLLDEIIGEIVVSGKAANDPQYVLVGSTLTFDLDIEFEQGDELDCAWVLVRSEDDFTELASCLDPLVLDESMVGGFIFVDGLLTSPVYDDVYVYGELSQEVRLPAESVQLELETPPQLRLRVSEWYHINAIVGSNQQLLRGPEYSIKINGKSVQNAGGDVPQFEFTPSEAEFGKELFADIELRSRNYDVVTRVVSLGTVQGYGVPVPTAGQVKITGDHTYGSTVHVEGLVVEVPGAKVTYQWSYGGVMDKQRTPIKGATGRSLKLPDYVSGRHVGVVVTVTHPLYLPETASGRSRVPKFRSTTPKVTAKLLKKSIKANATSKLAVRVTARGVAQPTGVITVKVGKKTFKKTLKASHKGRVTLTLKGLKPGKRQAVKVQFTASGTTAKTVKNSKIKTLTRITVTKAPKLKAKKAD